MEIVSWGNTIWISLSFGSGKAAEVSDAEIIMFLQEKFPQIFLRKSLAVTVFPGRSGYLIVVQKAEIPQVFYRFSSLGEAYNVLSAVPEFRNAELFEFCNAAVLAIETDYSCALAEFGEEISAPPDYLLFLREHAENSCRIPAWSGKPNRNS